MKKIIIALGFLAIISACSNEPCTVQAEEYLASIEELNEGWEQALDDILLGGSSLEATIGIMHSMDQMDAIVDEVRALSPPKCARESKEALIKYYELMLDSLYAGFDGNFGEMMELQNETIEAMEEHFRELDKIELDDS